MAANAMVVSRCNTIAKFFKNFSDLGSRSKHHGIGGPSDTLVANSSLFRLGRAAGGKAG